MGTIVHVLHLSSFLNCLGFLDPCFLSPFDISVSVVGHQGCLLFMLLKLFLPEREDLTLNFGVMALFTVLVESSVILTLDAVETPAKKILDELR